MLSSPPAAGATRRGCRGSGSLHCRAVRSGDRRRGRAACRRRGSDGRRLGLRRNRCSHPLLQVEQHVALGDATARTGALKLGKIQAPFRNQPAHRRRQGFGRRRGGGFGCCCLGRRTRRYGRIAERGDGRRREQGHRPERPLLPAPRALRRTPTALGRSFGLDETDDGANGHGLTLRDLDVQDAVGFRNNLQGHLVGFHEKKDLVLLHHVAVASEPLGQHRFGNRFSDRRYLDFHFHGDTPLSEECRVMSAGDE